MTEYRLPMQQGPPRRKPVNSVYQAYSPNGYGSPLPQQYPPPPPLPPLAHSRSRTSSSNALPAAAIQQQYQPAPAQTHQFSMTRTTSYSPPTRQSSTATSTSSGMNNSYGTQVTPQSDVRRSTSSRSANAQLGYVALLRRQKATAWCDRSQSEDPRLRAQKLAQKKKAYLEVQGGSTGRPVTLGSGKAKHGGKGVTDFSPSSLVGGAVPVRLSANEVGDADDGPSEDAFLRRPGSGRSSQGSGRDPPGHQRPLQSPITPLTPSEKTNPQQVPDDLGRRGDTLEDNNSLNSVQEEDYGTVGELGAPSAAITAAQKAQKADELRRRGSVDDRTTSSGVRLFIANPDLSD